MKNKLFIGLISLVLAATAIGGFIQSTHAAVDETILKGDVGQIGKAAFGEEDSAGTSLPNRIGAIIKVMLGILGVILVVIVIYAGFLWMTAGGDETQVKKAIAWIRNAVVGLVIIMSAYAITSYVIDALFKVSQQG